MGAARLKSLSNGTPVEGMDNNIESQCFTVTRLRSEFNLKPKIGAPVARSYINGYGTTCKLYLISDCIPVRKRATAPSKKQLLAQQSLRIKTKLRSAKMTASREAHNLLELAPIFLDTETTGLGEDAQIIEIALTDTSGKVLLESRLRPTIPIEEGATEVHGISIEDLANAPIWPEIAAVVEAILAKRVCVIFNSAFDSRIIENTAKAYNLSSLWFQKVDTRCAMSLAVDYFGATNRYGTISLVKAMDFAGVKFQGKAHKASVDAKATADLVQAIAKKHIDLQNELSELIRSTER